MANETEKNVQNEPGNVADPARKNPSQSGDVYNPQDPTKKNPRQGGDTTDRRDREGSDDVEKGRAS